MEKVENNIQDTRQADKHPVDGLVSLRPEVLNKIHLGDSFEFLESCPPNVFDLILEDMPYNTTACDWDVKIDLELYWKTRLRVLKPTGVVVLTSSQPFTTDLISSKRELFKYEIIWIKNKFTNFMQAKKMFMRNHENILVFYKKQPTFNPIKRKIHKHGKTYNSFSTKIYNVVNKKNYSGNHPEDLMGNPGSTVHIENEIESYNSSNGNQNRHPSQKPVGLFEYLIRTYTNEGDTVFDGFGGSGTTAIAAYRSNRNFIVVEKEKKYFELSKKRLAEEQQQCRLFTASN